MIGIGVIGYGYWGPNLVRNFAECRDATVGWCAIVAPSAWRKGRAPLSGASRDHPQAADLIADPAVDAVVIATPVDRHFELAMRGAARRQARAGREADGLDER